MIEVIVLAAFCVALIADLLVDGLNWETFVGACWCIGFAIYCFKQFKKKH